MKFIRWLTVTFILVFMFAISYEAMALDAGLSTQPLSDEEIADVSELREFKKITSFPQKAVKSFDVREDHMLVIGLNSGDVAIIAVYNGDGIYQYGFQTKEYGSFRVFWLENDVAYYSIRGETLYKIDAEGKIKEVYRVESTTENSIYDRDILAATTRMVGSTVYDMTNGNAMADKLFASYDKIIKTDSGEITTVYDASGNPYIYVALRLLVAILVFIILAIVIVYIAKLIGRRKTGNG